MCRRARGWKTVSEYNFDDEMSDDCTSEEENKGRDDLKKLSDKLDGAISWIIDKKKVVAEEIETITFRQYKLKEVLLENMKTTDNVVSTVDVMKMDLMTLIKQRKSKHQLYKLLNDIENNMYDIKMSTEKHLLTLVT